MFRVTINRDLEEVEFVFNTWREVTEFLTSAILNEQRHYKYDIERVEEKQYVKTL